MPLIGHSPAAGPLNPCRDYFKPGQPLHGLVASRVITDIADTAITIEHGFDVQIAELRIGTRRVPAANNSGAVVELAVNGLSCVGIADRSFLVGFTYALSPELEVECKPQIVAGNGEAVEPLALSSLSLRAQDGKAFAFVMFRLPHRVRVDLVRFRLLAVRAPGQYQPGVDIVPLPVVQLSQFVRYELFDYDVRYELFSGSASTTGKLNAPHTVWSWGAEPGKFDLAPPRSWVNVELIKREAPAAVLETFTSPDFDCSAEQPQLALVFPGQAERADKEAGAAGQCEFEVIRYVARLDYFGASTKRSGGGWRCLSIGEQWMLDVGRLVGRFQAVIGERPISWAVRCDPLSLPYAQWAAAPGTIDLTRLFDFYQRVGFTLLFGDTAGRPASELLELRTQSAAHELRLSFKFAWQDFLRLGGSSPRYLLTERAQPGTEQPTTDVFKVPFVNDVVEFRAISERFVRGQRALAQIAASTAGAQPLLIESGALGKENSGLPFAITPHGRDDYSLRRIREAVASGEVNIRRGSADPRLHSMVARISNPPLEIDAQYQQGFLPYVFDQFSALQSFLVERAQDSEFHCETFQASDRADLRDVRTCLVTLCGGAGSNLPRINYANYDHVVPGNGPYGSTEFGWPETIDSISVRRARALSAPAEELRDALWYLQHRYWNEVNIAYLCAADGAMRHVLRSAPVLHWANLSRPLGYWSGYEGYGLVRSGALDIVWMDDDYHRAYGASWHHLIFSNVRADYARALANLPRIGTTERPAPLRIGAYLHPDRADYKAIVWAARGARYFEQFNSADLYSTQEGEGWANTGLQSNQMLKQAKLAIDMLDRGKAALALTERASARIAILIPQTDSVWNCRDPLPTMSAAQSAGFVAPELLDGGLHGLHALLTHCNLPVDFVFEEALIEPGDALAGYAVLFVACRCLRDDAFYALANWVERGHLAVFVPVIEKSPAAALPEAWPCALFNEFARYRVSRRGWLELPADLSTAISIDGQAPRGWPTSQAEERIVSRGFGAVLLLAPAATGYEGARSPGLDYIDALLEPHRGAVLADSTAKATLLRAQMITALDRAIGVARANGAADMPANWYGLWRPVKLVRQDPVSGPTRGKAPSLLVELSYWTDKPSAPRAGAVFIINHRQRAFTRHTVGFDEDDDGDSTKGTDECIVELTGLPAQVRIRQARSPSAQLIGPMPTASRVLRWPISLRDYEILYWEAA